MKSKSNVWNKTCVFHPHLFMISGIHTQIFVYLVLISYSRQRYLLSMNGMEWTRASGIERNKGMASFMDFFYVCLGEAKTSLWNKTCKFVFPLGYWERQRGKEWHKCFLLIIQRQQPQLGYKKSVYILTGLGKLPFTLFT